eukprot:1691324-Pyramimonas_sp.AAC.1
MTECEAKVKGASYDCVPSTTHDTRTKDLLVFLFALPTSSAVRCSLGAPLLRVLPERRGAHVCGRGVPPAGQPPRPAQGNHRDRGRVRSAVQGAGRRESARRTARRRRRRRGIRNTGRRRRRGRRPVAGP